MRRLMTLALCVAAATSCAASTATLTVMKNSQEAKALHNSKCQALSSQEVSSLPANLKRKNVCFYGMLSVDSEFTVVFPSDASEKPTPWDVTIMLPPLSDPNRNLREFDGNRVLLIGDLEYDRSCWDLKHKPNQKHICAPASRPVYLSNATLILIK